MVLDILTALAEPTRLSAMMVLINGEEHCVCELMQRCAASQSRMSRHMGVLRAVGLVVDRRDAQWVRYRLNPDLPDDISAVVHAVVASCQNQKRRAA